MRWTIVVLSIVGCSEAGEPVSLAFAPRVGTEAFVCGETYSGLGSMAAELTPTDLRFFVHDVRLVEADGTEVRVHLDDDGRFQDGDVVLLDFEENCGDMGNAETKTTIEGTVRPGDYTGIRFTIGVPEERNHADPTRAGAPLNLTAMWWNWNAGYKFVRFDARSSAFTGWRLHLGSTSCEGDMMGNASCDDRNAPEIAIDGFDPTAEAVQIDLAALVAGSDLGNTGESPPGCLSGPDDPDCAPLFESLGLPFDGSTGGSQIVFGAP